MKLKFHYTKQTHGSMRWTASCVVPEIFENVERCIMLQSSPCSFKWGATRQLKRQVKQHFKAGKSKEQFSKEVEVKL